MLDACKPILTQLADILEVLRVHEVVHHDLKPQNVLVIPPATPLEAPTLKVRRRGRVAVTSEPRKSYHRRKSFSNMD
jgi:serine/threonine protein kinase